MYRFCTLLTDRQTVAQVCALVLPTYIAKIQGVRCRNHYGGRMPFLHFLQHIIIDRTY